MARTITVRRDGDDLSIDTDDLYGGREVMDDLLREVHPTVGYTARKVVGTTGALLTGKTRTESRQFFEDISGAPKGSNDYETARRNFQRYAKGRKPTLEKVEEYQENYQATHNGERSAILDDLILAAGGEIPDEEDEEFEELPPGDLKIEIFSRVTIDTGKRKKGSPPDSRDRAIVIDIPRARQRAAIADPLGEWSRQLEDSIREFDISDVQWIEARFTPKG